MRKYFLKTSRIAFSHWDNNDIDLAYTLWGDPAVTRYISANGLFSLEQVKDRLNKEMNMQKEFQVQ
ncbi:MAG: N-acetyltransferase, partial [Paenibacillus macerans]|nr:N-acetyltransferase [Paenibacillus macerans]